MTHTKKINVICSLCGKSKSAPQIICPCEVRPKHTDKILAEFDEMFPNLGATDPKEGWYDAKPEVKAFLTSKIAQALAEDREMVRGGDRET